MNCSLHNAVSFEASQLLKEPVLEDKRNGLSSFGEAFVRYRREPLRRPRWNSLPISSNAWIVSARILKAILMPCSNEGTRALITAGNVIWLTGRKELSAKCP